MSVVVNAHRWIEPGSRDPGEPRAVLEAQRSAFEHHTPTVAERLEALRALEHTIDSRQHDIVAAASEDFGGRAAEETLALEIVPLLTEIRYARRHLKRWVTPRRASVSWPFWPATARIVYQPLGVVGVMSTWNYPFFLGLAPLAGILAAGNHALLKPSELAPASAALIGSIVSETFPSSYVASVRGGADVAADFSALPFDHLLFTGSGRVGRLVMEAASRNLVPVTLELGGKTPAIVHDDYAIEKAATRILTGKLYNAGQTCVAPDYVMVPRGRASDFVTAAKAAIARLYPSLVNSGDYTRIINARHYRRLADLVDDARRRGAEVVEVAPLGDSCDASNRVFPPTLVMNVRDEMAVMEEEIFGPVLPVVEYDTLDEAVAYLRKRPRPLALYYFDTHRGRIREVIERTVSGGVTVNVCLFHVGQPGLPFGGVGASGMGRYHGFDGFQTFSNRKSVLFQPRWSPLALLRPPYGRSTELILRFLLR